MNIDETVCDLIANEIFRIVSLISVLSYHHEFLACQIYSRSHKRRLLTSLLWHRPLVVYLRPLKRSCNVQIWITSKFLHLLIMGRAATRHPRVPHPADLRDRE